MNNLNFKILTKPSFRISTKIKLNNLNQALAAKYWSRLSFNFKISTEPCGQSLNKNLELCMTKLLPPNLHQIIVNTFPSINICNSSNLNKFN